MTPFPYVVSGDGIKAKILSYNFVERTELTCLARCKINAEPDRWRAIYRFDSKIAAEHLQRALYNIERVLREYREHMMFRLAVWMMSPFSTKAPTLCYRAINLIVKY